MDSFDAFWKFHLGSWTHLRNGFIRIWRIQSGICFFKSSVYVLVSRKPSLQPDNVRGERWQLTLNENKWKEQCKYGETNYSCCYLRRCGSTVRRAFYAVYANSTGRACAFWEFFCAKTMCTSDWYRLLLFFMDLILIQPCIVTTWPLSTLFVTSLVFINDW